MKIETERLMIREIELQDTEAVHRYSSDLLVTTYMEWGPNTQRETAEFINRVIQMQQQRPRVDFELAVALKETDALIGGCGIHVSEPDQGEIGYCLGPNYWRQGYASEAAAALLQFGFHELGLHRIYATCRPQNIGSAAVMQKIGMAYEGHLRGHKRYKGGWHDSYQYSILKHEFFGR